MFGSLKTLGLGLHVPMNQWISNKINKMYVCNIEWKSYKYRWTGYVTLRKIVVQKERCIFSDKSGSYVI